MLRNHIVPTKRNAEVETRRQRRDTIAHMCHTQKMMSAGCIHQDMKDQRGGCRRDENPDLVEKLNVLEVWPLPSTLPGFYILRVFWRNPRLL